MERFYKLGFGDNDHRLQGVTREKSLEFSSSYQFEIYEEIYIEGEALFTFITCDLFHTMTHDNYIELHNMERSWEVDASEKEIRRWFEDQREDAHNKLVEHLEEALYEAKKLSII